MSLFGNENDFIKEFFDYLNNLISEDVKNENKNEKKCCDAKKHEHSHYYESKERLVDGEIVEKSEEEWKDGKCVKDEHYRKYGSICGGNNVKKIGCCETKKQDAPIEYQIEFDEINETDNLRRKNDMLRNSVNQLCEDAEKANKKIRKLKEENAILRSEIEQLKDTHQKNESTLIEEIDKLETELKNKNKLIDSFKHFMDAVKQNDSFLNINNKEAKDNE